MQRSPRYHLGSPDLLGVDKKRYLYEIEVKRSAADFRANANKCHIANRRFTLDYQPRQFYFLMPQQLAERMLPEVPDYAGLMAADYLTIRVIKPAPINEASRRLTVKETVRFCELMANQLVAQSRAMLHYSESEDWQSDRFAEYII